MPPAKKRKISDDSILQDGAPVDRAAVPKSQDSPHIDKGPDAEPSRDTQSDPGSVDKNQERIERFKALQARAVSLLRPTASGMRSTDLYAAKVRSEEPQRSGGGVATAGDRPQHSVLTFPEAGIRITQPAESRHSSGRRRL